MKDELIGLSEISSDIIKCGDCGQKLVDLVVTESNESRIERGLKPQESKYQILKCPNCNGSSFPTKVYYGSVIMGTQNDKYCIEYEDSDVLDDGVIFVKVILTKK